MYVDTTADERMARMRARRKASGLVEVRVWVRPDQVEQVRAIAAAAPAQADPSVPQAIADPEAPVGWSVTFRARPRFELRERLKRLGFRFDQDQQAWRGSLPIDRMTAIRGDLEHAGGKIARR